MYDFFWTKKKGKYMNICLGKPPSAVYRGYERVADYAWLKKGKKYWNIWVGNPFCITLHKIPLSISKKSVITELKTSQTIVKKQFAKRFPDIEWESTY